MLLRITHETDLSYNDLISESAMELRMAPRQESDQHRLSFQLAIGPAATVTSYFDWLGNTVHTFTINPFHQQIRIVATSVVETDREVPDIWSLADIWPVSRHLIDYSCYDYQQFGGPIIDCPQLRDLVASLRPREGASLGKLCLQIMQLVDSKFTYEKGVTTAASPITEILEHGRGVCQDFTHLMIAIARALGIPARYVSGFVHRDGERTRGWAQTHAWCELLIPSVGWIGFDPTNNCLIGRNMVKVAIGRDFRDVPPNRGVYRGKADESIHVGVDIEELPTIPSALVAERYHSIDLAVYTQRRLADAQLVAQQQEQQQQEIRQQQEQQQQTRNI
ncbi:MAG TPA: transglutaminase family protein [Tepidisphaeraceae bacterium]|nr:transglutaminase family protein [Tepidisphaeraceae bacterium]